MNGNAVFHRQNLYPPDFSALTYSALTVILNGVGSRCYPTGQFLYDFLPMRKQITSLAEWGTSWPKPRVTNGKLMVIDGGFSKAYQPETGIAGYTLVYHSRGFQLVQHEPFTSTQKAIEEGLDIKSTTQIVEMSSKRMMVKDTDKGRELSIQINDLKKLLVAYRTGTIKEKSL